MIRKIIIKEPPFIIYVQPFYSWSETFVSVLTRRQVSRLKDHRIHHLPSFPVISRLQLPNYGDEFVQDLHLFPFSPEPIVSTILPTPSCTYSISLSVSYLYDKFNLYPVGSVLLPFFFSSLPDHLMPEDSLHKVHFPRYGSETLICS